jgi:chemotaxis protein MotA
MNKRNGAALAVSLVAFLGSFMLVGGLAAYWNAAALLVVLSGLACAALLSYPFERLSVACKVVRRAYSGKQPSPEQIVTALLDIAVRSKVDGVLSLEKLREKTTISYLRNGLMFLVDNYKEQEIRDFLTTETAFFKLRRQQSERVFQTLARVAPAFGVAGSVIGLIGLLMGIQDTQIILKNIPIAFISTLYGVVLGNMVFAPMAEAIRCDTGGELLNQKIILEGIVAISREQNPHKLEKKLSSFLPPSEREGKAEQLRSITRHYVQKKRMSAEEAAVLDGEPLEKRAEAQARAS